MSAKDGGTAFPATRLEKNPAFAALGPGDHYSECEYPGMSLRDYFAGQALAGLAEAESPQTAAQNAYLYADEMLKAREAAK